PVFFESEEQPHVKEVNGPLLAASANRPAIATVFAGAGPSRSRSGGSNIIGTSVFGVNRNLRPIAGRLSNAGGPLYRDRPASPQRDAREGRRQALAAAGLGEAGFDLQHGVGLDRRIVEGRQGERTGVLQVGQGADGAVGGLPAFGVDVAQAIAAEQPVEEFDVRVV